MATLTRTTTESVVATQARVVAATVRRLAEEAEGQKRRELRDLTVRASDLARDLEAVLG